MVEGRGFTLLEILVALTILAIVVAVIYASFATVADTITVSRTSMEEIRLRQFLARSLTVNFTGAYADPEFQDARFIFQGIDGEDQDGPADAISFCSTAQLVGGMALPGDLKVVRYEVIGEESSDLTLDADVLEEEPGRMLQVTETPISNTSSTMEDLTEEAQALLADLTSESPSWTVPVRTFDITYFDGTDWVEEWDSMVLGRLPWSVQIKVNFAKTDELLEAEALEGFDIHDDPDFEMVVAIPLGTSVLESAESFEERRSLSQSRSNTGSSAKDDADKERRSSRRRGRRRRNRRN